MRRAIAEAEVGDAVLGDDPTVAELERGVGAALDTITVQDARGFVRHCGYTL